jgi:hypothetical protein
MKKYFADVRIFVEAESAEEAAQELNDAVSYAVHAGGFTLTDYNTVVDMDVIEETK